MHLKQRQKTCPRNLVKQCISRRNARFLSAFFFPAALVVPPALLLDVVVAGGHVPLAPLPSAATEAAPGTASRLVGSPACFLGCGPSPGSCGTPEVPPCPPMAWISVS
ncbi:hypothetical protein CRUP_027194, partial [Coryphaenoides rupestris]